MCGICCVISIHRPPSPDGLLLERLQNRGPDHLGSVDTSIPATAGDEATLFASFTTSVLALRGDGVTEQPFIDKGDGSVFCWNGEAWHVGGNPVLGNDGETIFKLLSLAETHSEILDVLRSIKGPFAFLYLTKRYPATLFFGRDRLGRRSLLKHSDPHRLSFSSVANPSIGSWSEVEADGIYAAYMDSCVEEGFSDFSRFDWLPNSKDHVLGLQKLNISLPTVSIQPSLATAVRALRARLSEALGIRILRVPLPPGASDPNEARIAILFSGGLDCTVLARLAADILPPGQVVDLINVAFENPRVAAQLQATNGDKTTNIYEACPDRITGRLAFRELKTVCPDRQWRFIAVNVPYSETLAHRAEVVALMHPHNTEMDLSISYALYFASRGRGLAQMEPETVPDVYSTKARVLLSGLGADELFGGYIHHATAFSRQGYPGLIQALEMDVARLGKRNLGRDDRVMAHWSREVRFPYLAEEVVAWALEQPVWNKCDFGTPMTDDGIEAGKRVLRLLAADLGMTGVAREKKRAVRQANTARLTKQMAKQRMGIDRTNKSIPCTQIQFGARTAKMESGRVKGTSVIT